MTLKNYFSNTTVYIMFCLNFQTQAHHLTLILNIIDERITSSLDQFYKNLIETFQDKADKPFLFEKLREKANQIDLTRIKIFVDNFDK